MKDAALLERASPLVDWYIIRSVPPDRSDEVHASASRVFARILEWVHTPKWEWRSRPLTDGMTPNGDEFHAAVVLVLSALEFAVEHEPDVASIWIAQLEPFVRRRYRPALDGIRPDHGRA